MAFTVARLNADGPGLPSTRRHRALQQLSILRGVLRAGSKFMAFSFLHGGERRLLHRGMPAACDVDFARSRAAMTPGASPTGQALALPKVLAEDIQFTCQIVASKCKNRAASVHKLPLTWVKECPSFGAAVRALLKRNHSNDNSERKCGPKEIGNDENFVFVQHAIYKPHECRDCVKRPRQKRDATGIMLDPDYPNLVSREQETQHTHCVREGINAQYEAPSSCVS
jgi:hypothetical protein